MAHPTLVPALALCLCAACGSDPVSYSAPVSITLKAKSGDVSGTTVTELKAITTETSNPYGTFITDARAELGGQDPGRIELDALTLTLGAMSTNVAALQDVFAGDVEAAILADTSNNTYDAGHVVDPTGAGPVAMSVTFAWDDVSPVDVAKLVGGSFKVVLRGTAATGFATKGADADLQLTFTFAAFE